MPPRSKRPSLLSPSLFAVSWNGAVWAGWGLVLLAAYHVQNVIPGMPAAFWVIAALVIVGELRPVLTAKGADPQGTVTSTAFVLAILYLWGFWPAVLLQAGATLVAEWIKRKPPWKVFFNVGQYELTLLATWGVMALAGHPDGLRGERLHGSDFIWMALGWVVWFVTNNLLVSGVWADEGKGFWSAFTEDLRYYVLTTAAVLALSPIVVLAAASSGGSVWFIPLVLVPLEAVRQTGRISLEEQHAAHHDPLTGLPNRKLLLRTVESALDQCARGCEPFALFLLDLDRFKEVNDTLGHHTGDRLLELVARRIQGALREGDVVGRLGGDEFAIYLPNIATPQEALEVAMRVRDALVGTFHLDEVLLQLEASIGVALHPRHGADVGGLMRRADVAMYLAKETRSEIEVYDPARDRHSASRLGLLAELRHAIDSGELDLHYQPKVDLSSSGLVGMEALLRWDHPERGPIAPDEFIPLAENSGLMHRLTAYVIDKALGQVADWRAQGLDVVMGVNVSARDLNGGELARQVSEALATHRVPATHLQLELTERTLMAEQTRVMDTLDALEALDVSLSLDDFGTGYSSMFMLKRLPVTEIKVDQSFVARLAVAGAEEDASIVRSIVDLAHALGMQAVAEGVESEDTWQRLRALGCDSAQGFYIARPMDAGDATRWLREHSSWIGKASLHLVPEQAEGA
jgi:diguanylate cyclase (GGDEF)-like protein